MATENYRVMIAALVVEGMVATARAQVSVIYLFETLKKEHFGTAYAIMSSFEGIFGVLGSLYFMYVSKSWFWLLLGAYFLQVIGTIGVCFFPESPKYLVKSGQLLRAQEVFAKIARFNKANPALVTNERIEHIFKTENNR